MGKGKRSGEGLPTITAWMRKGTINAHYRVILPLRGIERAGLAQVQPVVDAETDDDLSGPAAHIGDVLLVNGTAGAPTLARIRDRLRAQGTIVVFDEDDNGLEATCGDWETTDNEPYGIPELGVPWDRSRSLLEHEQTLARAAVKLVWPVRSILPLLVEWADTQPELRPMYEAIQRAPTAEAAMHAVLQTLPHSRYREAIRQADLLTLPTLGFVKLYGQLNPNAHLLPNVIDLQLPCYQSAGRQVPHQGVVLGWAGSRSHLHDVEMVAPVIKTLLREYDGTDGEPLVRLMLGGDWRHFYGCFRDLPGMDAFTALAKREVNAAAEQQIMLQRFVTVESTCGRYIYRSFTALPDESPAMYADVDIGILPLVDDRSNRIKTDLKGLELAGMAVPCVASAVGSYPEFRGPGTGCILASTEQEWTEALRRLIEDAELRRRMGDEARRFAETRTIDVWAPKWMQVYTEALTEKRRRRGAA